MRSALKSLLLGACEDLPNIGTYRGDSKWCSNGIIHVIQGLGGRMLGPDRLLVSERQSERVRTPNFGGIT